MSTAQPPGGSIPPVPVDPLFIIMLTRFMEEKPTQIRAALSDPSQIPQWLAPPPYLGGAKNASPIFAQLGVKGFLAPAGTTIQSHYPWPPSILCSCISSAGGLGGTSALGSLKEMGETNGARGFRELVDLDKRVERVTRTHDAGSGRGETGPPGLFSRSLKSDSPDFCASPSNSSASTLPSSSILPASQEISPCSFSSECYALCGLFFT
ncbi:hypothetical protein BDK51DRAFT_45254 [Blyttiomyces helicus]|uniref:Uncharacterized protein n=1 Tax=Blyttiomyces helicus TaxID=388810 RepID=A0A4P9WRY5_9FUNG|nr:hypothetical protein BDK51DRAFT_45254 [Blyttiomyces helicus]|eukprot:RKO93716.1 hypothetical protein BDK51DRAFT_45254 [Blyttiomyces helicus]